MAAQGEGKDVQLFRALCNSTFEKIAKSVSEERYVQLFRPLAGSTSKCKNICGVLQSTIPEDLKTHLNEMIEEEKLNEKFTKRAELLQNQKEFEGTVAWRPTGDPVKDQRSHDIKVLKQMKAGMEEYLSEKEPYLDALLEKVRQERKEASDLHSTIHKLLHKIAADDTTLDEFEEDSLRVLQALAPSCEDR